MLGSVLDVFGAEFFVRDDELRACGTEAPTVSDGSCGAFAMDGAKEDQVVFLERDIGVDLAVGLVVAGVVLAAWFLEALEKELFFAIAEDAGLEQDDRALLEASGIVVSGHDNEVADVGADLCARFGTEAGVPSEGFLGAEIIFGPIVFFVLGGIGLEQAVGMEKRLEEAFFGKDDRLDPIG